MNKEVYNSIFQKEIHDLIELKRALGFSYESEAGSLRRIDTFLCKNNLSEKCITKELCDLWCRKRTYETVTNQASRISIMRVFCRYLNDIGIPAYIPPKGITKKRIRYDAHIYTDEELQSFFNAVDKSKSVPDSCPYRSDVMPVFFRILYTSGMRVSELRLARIRDINLEEGYINVHEAKNHKERLIPIHPLLIIKCKELKEKIHVTSPDDEYFFMILPGKPMTLGNVYKNFRRYLEQAGISHTGKGPRIHDFRHTYCVNLLRKWTDEGKDLIAYLPYMRTMLGHESFEETAYYLKLTAAKVMSKPSQKTVFGPAYPVIMDVPIPLGLPFGFVPKRPDRATGLLMPTFGEEAARGFYFRDLGLYFVIGDYFDISLTTSLYTLGSWNVDINSRYKVNYKCTGTFGFTFSNDQTGEKGSADFFQSRNFSVKWSHQQDSKARPGTSFSASVNFSSPANSKYNSHSVTEEPDFVLNFIFQELERKGQSFSQRPA